MIPQIVETLTGPLVVAYCVGAFALGALVFTLSAVDYGWRIGATSNVLALGMLFATALQAGHQVPRQYGDYGSMIDPWPAVLPLCTTLLMVGMVILIFGLGHRLNGMLYIGAAFASLAAFTQLVCLRYSIEDWRWATLVFEILSILVTAWGYGVILRTYDRKVRKHQWKWRLRVPHSERKPVPASRQKRGHGRHA
jgi:hypothetical protein